MWRTASCRGNISEPQLQALLHVGNQGGTSLPESQPEPSCMSFSPVSREDGAAGCTDCAFCFQGVGPPFSPTPSLQPGDAILCVYSNKHHITFRCYPVLPGRRPPSPPATSGAPPCLSTIFRFWVFLCTPTGCRLLFFFLALCSFCLCV